MEGEKEIIKAAKKGSVEALKALLAYNPALVGVTEADGSTPLHCAAWKGFPEACEVLLTAGANVNAHSTGEHYGGTPLHAAAHGNWKDVVAVLLRYGADVNAVSSNGRKPLDETEFHKATAAAKLLREHGATPTG
jgi:ankyrin repeat protein